MPDGTVDACVSNRVPCCALLHFLDFTIAREGTRRWEFAGSEALRIAF